MSTSDEQFIAQMLGQQDFALQFRIYLYSTFGPEFGAGLIQNGSPIYITDAGLPAIDFQEIGYDFRLSKSLSNSDDWQLTIRDQEGKDFITNVVTVPRDSTPDEMTLVFHSLKTEMIIELGNHTQQKQFEEDLRNRRNADIVEPDEYLPNTLIRLADWECQLILEFVKSGCEPKVAISKAKFLVWMQINKEGYAPGDLSLIDKCKPSSDQK